jgi:hypothetical protein
VIQGVGTIALADEIAPFSSASKLAASMECAAPRSSAWIMSSFESRGWPSRSAIVLVWAGSAVVTRSDTTDDQSSECMEIS